MGKANFNKNLFVGTWGLESINLSHFMRGLRYGESNLMGQGHNPLRSILNYCTEKYLGQLDLWYILTVMGANGDTGQVEMKGMHRKRLWCIWMRSIILHSTWLGNKSIYRWVLSLCSYCFVLELLKFLVIKYQPFDVLLFSGHGWQWMMAENSSF